ncbi:hypothetical protein AAFF_G00099260 [Aldrovandia affinis]|uniref:Reverse transcriptase/retrotransposon-derived protein RNase H-like domain-containing protein n=1 Tax=Aldrovandia affinis TaxID=143900 RepID=A0AAD7WCF8_9TELE|nr:hypothetical protein AAFF_G00099260 [Aldrovandia affinis]
MPGESLRLLANDIESLTRRAYGHMPSEVQSELARDQFIRALTPADLRAQPTGGAQQRSRGGLAPPSPEVDDITVSEPTVVVGRAGDGDSCYVPVTIEGVPCSALVDTGSTVTLVRPDVVPGGTPVEPTAVQLRTVTGELAPLVGKSMLSVTVGGRAVRHPVWIAAVQEPCILGLDFLKATGCQLDLERGTLRLQEGPAVKMAPVITSTTPPVRLVHAAACSPTSQSALAQLPQVGEEGMRAAVREVWRKNCDGLDPQQQGQLWQLLLDFRDSFAMSEGELLQKDRDFVWTEQCQEAFSSLQRALSEAPVLFPPDTTLPFILDTDASGVGAGGVLSQAQGVTCRELQMVDAAEWRRQQEQDTDLQPVLQWVEVQQRPLVDEVAVLSKATKGLWAAFESLRLCDCVLQRAWKEPATGEEKWQVVVPKGLKDSPLPETDSPDPLSPYPQQHATPHRGRGGPQVT